MIQFYHDNLLYGGEKVLTLLVSRTQLFVLNPFYWGRLSTVIEITPELTGPSNGFEGAPFGWTKTWTIEYLHKSKELPNSKCATYDICFYQNFYY